MSRRISNSQPSPPPNRAPLTPAPFPKRNGWAISSLPFCVAVERKLPCQPTRRPTTAVDRSLRSATRKLEFHPTRFFSATSKFLIDNFERFVSSEFASHSTLATSHFFSNRHTYEKLELAVNALASTTSIFLIDTKPHFVQGKIAQFQCSARQHALKGGFTAY